MGRFPATALADDDGSLRHLTMQVEKKAGFCASMRVTDRFSVFLFPESMPVPAGRERFSAMSVACMGIIQGRDGRIVPVCQLPEKHCPMVSLVLPRVRFRNMRERIDVMGFGDALKRILACVTAAAVSGAVMLMIAGLSDGDAATRMLNPIIYLAGIIFITVSVGVIFDTVRKYRAFRKSEEENCERRHPHAV